MVGANIEEINTVFMESEGSLNLIMSATLAVAGDGAVSIVTRLSFTKGKVSELCSSTVNEGQKELPFGQETGVDPA